MAGKKSSDNVYCSFCGKPQEMVGRLIAGNGVFICDQCVDLCMSILEEGEYTMPEGPGEFKPVTDKLLKPVEIKKILDDYVIGQETAKKTLAVAVYNHYKRVFKRDENIEFSKSNVLMLGPTGVGKTLLAQTLARALDVPFAIADATTLTEAGYVGEDVENILLKLIQAADFDIEKAERGIIYIDEIDKIARANVPPQGGRKHPQQEFLQIDTRNILFICAGAFDGLDKVVKKRLGSSVLGFEADVSATNEALEKDWMKHVTGHDLIKFGIIPELIGRLPVIAALSDLSEDDLVRVLTEPKNSVIAQYKHLFKLDNVELLFEKEALYAIAKLAREQNTGARGLRGIIEGLLTDLMFETPSDNTIEKIIITRDVVENGAQAKIIRNDSAFPMSHDFDEKAKDNAS